MGQGIALLLEKRHFVQPDSSNNMILNLTADRTTYGARICHCNTECHHCQCDQSTNNLKISILKHNFHPLAFAWFKLTKAYEDGIKALIS
jgi:hypothetical protein